jgi:hypothetical protein
MSSVARRVRVALRRGLEPCVAVRGGGESDRSGVTMTNSRNPSVAVQG